MGKYNKIIVDGTTLYFTQGWDGIEYPSEHTYFYVPTKDKEKKWRWKRMGFVETGEFKLKYLFSLPYHISNNGISKDRIRKGITEKLESIEILIRRTAEINQGELI